MRHRMLIAMLALIGTLLALYLWLWKIGVVGVLACGSGACETVQLSRYADFLGLPVALYGVCGYATLLAVSLVGLQPNWVHRRGPTLLLVALSGVGVAFTAYLTYIEGAVIHAWCRWCLASATIIGAIFVAALVGTRGGHGGEQRGAAGSRT
jgi:uncharacterized membrane protein